MTFGSIREYAEWLAHQAGVVVADGQIFAKVLTRNDDSGRHGVLIPSDAYAVLPDWSPRDPAENDTHKFTAFDARSKSSRLLAYKYYQRYPERRLTCLNPAVNGEEDDGRLFVFMSAVTTAGDRVFILDCANNQLDQRFGELWALLSGGGVAPGTGGYLTVPISYSGLVIDSALAELLQRFDGIRNKWTDALREGDTGIGYTFETLLGIAENNLPTPDFRGIELKCKRVRTRGGPAIGKVNLFQQGPEWADKNQTSLERLRALGKPDAGGLYRCFSQVTTRANNLALRLDTTSEPDSITLRKLGIKVGHWTHGVLKKRLIEKHSRAAFILAEVRQSRSRTSFSYNELIYCEQPSMERFVELVGTDRLVFEFLMYEKDSQTVRNRGYPWRLLNEGLLDQLFSVRAKLR